MSDNLPVSVQTFWARIYMSGPIEIAKQVCRDYCLREGACVTVDPTHYIYTGGEESGFVVGLLNYPRFPATPEFIQHRATLLMHSLLNATHQHSALLMTPTETTWVTRRSVEK